MDHYPGPIGPIGPIGPCVCAWKLCLVVALCSSECSSENSSEDSSEDHNDAHLVYSICVVFGEHHAIHQTTGSSLWAL